MNERIQPRSNLQSPLIQTPDLPFPARKFFKLLRQHLEATHGPLSYDRLARMGDLPKSTAHAWFEYFDPPQLAAVMKWLERLPEDSRHQLVDAHCRSYPTLAHSALAHAPAKVSQMRDLLEKPAGLTLITGGTDATRSFILTALGHAASTVPQVTGIDLHVPNRFVPVAGITYLGPNANPHLIASAVATAWPKLQKSKFRFFLGNQLWSQVPSIRAQLLDLTTSAHVMLAGDHLPQIKDLKRQVHTTIHVITVSATNRVIGGIRINCRQIKPSKRQ